MHWTYPPLTASSMSNVLWPCQGLPGYLAVTFPVTYELNDLHLNQSDFFPSFLLRNFLKDKIKELLGFGFQRRVQATTLK